MYSTEKDSVIISHVNFFQWVDCKRNGIYSCQLYIVIWSEEYFESDLA